MLIFNLQFTILKRRFATLVIVLAQADGFVLFHIADEATAEAAEIVGEKFYIIVDFVARAGERSRLVTHGTHEANFAAEFTPDLFNIEHIWLAEVEHVHAGLDEVAD